MIKNHIYVDKSKICATNILTQIHGFKQRRLHVQYKTFGRPDESLQYIASFCSHAGNG